MRMSNKLIPHGPFKGTAIPVEDTRAQPDGDGVWWPARDRTPHVLERFPIDPTPNSFRHTIEREPSSLMLPQRSPTGEFYVGADGKVLLFPTMYITATLRGMDNEPRQQATTLAIIDGPKAYEQGENNARNRLYEALGLSGAHYLDEFAKGLAPVGATASVVPIGSTPAVATAAPASSAPSATTVSATSPMSQVKAVPSSIRKSSKAAPTPVTPAAPTASPATAESATESSGITPSLLATAQQKAAMKGVECPAFTSEDQVLAFLDELAAA
jgi:hypothetical protein